MRPHKRLIIILLIGALCLNLIPAVTGVSQVEAADGNWVRDSANPVFTRGREAEVACVIYDSDAGKYKMWYTQGTANLNNLDGLIDNIFSLSLGSLIDDIRNLRFSDIASNDAGNIKTIIDYLASLNVTDLQGLFTGTGSVIGYATSVDGVTWQFQSNVLAGTGGAWDKYVVGAPSVIKTGTGYEMWYTGGTMNMSLVAKVLDDLALLSADNISILLRDIVDRSMGNFFTHLRAARGDPYLTDLISDFANVINSASVGIGHATSTDGIQWIKDASPVLSKGTGSVWDKYGVATPTVLKVDNTYQMWYTGFGINYSGLLGLLTAQNINDLETALLQSVNVAIGHATSTDGINWTKDASPVLSKGTGSVWDKYGVATPTVLKVDNTYQMWYTGIKLVPNTFLDFLKGTSGLTNTLINGTSSAIGYASSSDGVNWTKDASNPVLSKGAGGTWDRGGVGAPCVLKSGNTYYMWYSGGTSKVPTFILDILADNVLADALADSGTRIAIGRASTTISTPAPGPSGGGGGGGPGLEPGVTNVAFFVDSHGVFTQSVTASCSGGKCSVTIEQGTKGLTKEGTPLSQITVKPVTTLPPPPTGVNIIGEACDFGPEGATFDQPVTLTFTYNDNQIPDGFDEQKLVIAVWDTVAGQWVSLVSVVDPVKNIITVEVTNFAKYAILAYREAVFTISGLSISAAEVNIGQSVTISATVANTGDLAGSYKVTLKINNTVIETKDINIDGHTSKTVTFTTAKWVAGTYSVDVNGQSGTFTVKAAPSQPAPAAFRTTSLTVWPSKVNIGESVIISALVANTGDLAGSYKVILKINNIVVDTKDITIDGHASKAVKFTTSKGVAGTYTVDIDGQSGTFTVTAPIEKVRTRIPWWVWLIVGLAVVAVIGVVVWLVVIRPRFWIFFTGGRIVILRK